MNGPGGGENDGGEGGGDRLNDGGEGGSDRLLLGPGS